jgi:hypothetical protein
MEFVKDCILFVLYSWVSMSKQYKNCRYKTSRLRGFCTRLVLLLRFGSRLRGRRRRLIPFHIHCLYQNNLCSIGHGVVIRVVFWRKHGNVCGDFVARLLVDAFDPGAFTFQLLWPLLALRRRFSLRPAVAPSSTFCLACVCRGRCRSRRNRSCGKS